MNSIVLCPSVPPGVERHDFDLMISTTCIEIPVSQIQLLGSLDQAGQIIKCFLIYLILFYFFFKLKCRVISNQHKWCLNREHSQSRYPTTIPWPGEEIYWHSPHEQDVH